MTISRSKLLISFFTTAIIFALLILGVDYYLHNRPMTFADIRVPVMLRGGQVDRLDDGSSIRTYRPGEQVQGIIFGQSYSSLTPVVARSIICNNYEAQATGPVLSHVRKLNGVQAPLATIERPSKVPSGGVSDYCIVTIRNVYTTDLGIFGRRVDSFEFNTGVFRIVWE